MLDRGVTNRQGTRQILVKTRRDSDSMSTTDPASVKRQEDDGDGNVLHDLALDKDIVTTWTCLA